MGDRFRLRPEISHWGEISAIRTALAAYARLGASPNAGIARVGEIRLWGTDSGYGLVGRRSA